MKIISAIFLKDFVKQFKKVDKKIQEEFHRRLKIFLENHNSSILNNHSLHGEWEGYWSINITGDFRAIYKVSGSVAIFVVIGTHNQLYK